MTFDWQNMTVGLIVAGALAYLAQRLAGRPATQGRLRRVPGVPECQSR